MSCPVKVHAHHVACFATDLDRTVAWWEEMFGFKKMFEGPFFLPDYGNARMAWVKCPTSDFYIELYDFPGLPGGSNMPDYWKTYGTKHVCLWVEDDQWDALIAHLEEKGAKIVVRAEHPPEKLNKPTSCQVIFLLDPDGTSVEVQQSFTPGEYGL